jgi:Mg2+-importing ATPase
MPTPAPRRPPAPEPDLGACWALSADELFAALDSGSGGLDAPGVERRRRRFGANVLSAQASTGGWRLLGRQFRSPLVLILIAAAGISALVQEWVDATIVLAVVAGSTLLGFVQEFRATHAVERLRSQVSPKCIVVRTVRDTVFGGIAERLRPRRRAELSFDRPARSSDALVRKAWAP